MSLRSVCLHIRSFPSSWSSIPGALSPRTANGFRGLCSAAENSKYSVIDMALNSVVKVFCRSSKSSVLQPWQKRLPKKSSGSGFVISKNKILTNAHVVADHTFVQVRKHGLPTLHMAKVEAVGHDCDLAVLVIDSKKFWEDMKPVDLGGIPSLQQTVSVVGYPVGGDNICVTKGVVSRVEVGKYSHSQAKLMTIQVDAAINGGNSGGPVFMENKVVGVAFQGYFWRQNTGYMIPTPVINHFLSSIEENGDFPGFCSLGILYQHMENACIREYFKMTPKRTGILIKKINPLSSCYNILKKDDVLLSIDGVSIANNETVILRRKERIEFSHLVSMKKPGEKVTLKVLREGRQLTFDINIKLVKPLIPVHQYDKVPSYYIFGGFVFSPLTKPLTNVINKGSLLKKFPKNSGDQIVIISQVLADKINEGYTSFKNFQVKKVNGVQVENLKQLSGLIEECCTEYLRLDLEDENTIILNHKSARKESSKILKRYGVPAAMSKDLRSTS